MVLTKRDHYGFIINPNPLYNYTFLYLLREFNVLFIGLSRFDQNIRRLLHYSKNERLKSLDQNELSEEELIRGTRRHFVILRRGSDTFVDTSMEKSLDTLGTEALWIDEY